MGMAGCGQCTPCKEGAPIWCAQIRSLQGGFAEYALANEFSALRLPESLGPLDGALIEPLACSHHAVDLAEMKPGARVLILGAGIIGLGVALFARQAGASKIAMCARSRQHAGFAQAIGVDSFLQQSAELPQEALEALSGKPDIVFDCVGVPGIIEQAMTCVAPRGTIVVAGLCMSPDMTVPAIAVFKELRVQYALAYRMPDFEAVSQLMVMDPGRTRPLVTETVSLEDFSNTFESLRGSTPHCKVLVGDGL
jgi:(R,R)-butanediol dehydrogenase/meso-butanediol dehydrogenase/diacetyl reductase